MITRDALAYVAEVSREGILFATPQKSSISQLDNTSIDGDDDSKAAEELSRLREEKLMKLLGQSEIKK